jgi:DNA-3-methyladenine glycosylase
MKRPPSDFLRGPSPEVAPLLLGWRLASLVGGVAAEVALTEVEAYSSEDPASHAYNGLRPRNAAMFGPPGTLYVYRSYGIHWCANVVCGDIDIGAAVLVRAGVPTTGIDAMVNRRGRENHLADGPGKLTQALAIDISHNHLDLFDPASPIRLLPGDPPPAVHVTTRIGITKATELPWRFVSML